MKPSFATGIFALALCAARVAAFGAVLMASFSASAGGPFINGSFVKGANLPWLDGAYGHDIGITPVNPDYGCAYSTTDMNKALSDMHSMGITVVRMWINEEEQGLVLDNNGYITGLQPLFLTNLDNIIQLAQANQISMYLTLANSYDSDGSDGPDLLTNPRMQGSYISNAIVPLAKRYKGNASVFAFDVMNEIDALSPFGYGSASWAQIQTFVSNSVAAIHGADPTRLASCSLGFGPAWPRLAELKNLGMDFYDFHDYEDVPQDAANFYSGDDGDHVTGFPTVASLNLDKPILIGECGQYSQTVNDTIQNTAVLDYLDLGKSNGFAGVLPWAYGVTSDPDYLSFLNGDGSWRPVCTTIKNFTAGNPPLITRFTPSSDPSGPVIFDGRGLRVFIYGTNLTGATSVGFNGVGTTNLTVFDDNELVVMLPTNATTGLISVTGPGGTGLSSSNFTLYTVPPGSLTIYNSEFASNFDTGIGAISSALVDVSNTVPVYESEYSVSVTFDTNSNETTFYVWCSPEFSTLPYGSFEFWINGGATGVAGLEVGAWEELFPVGTYALPNLPANTWMHFNIPLSALGAADLLDCDGFSFQATSGAGTFYLDGLQLDPYATGPTVSAPVANLVSGHFIMQISGVQGSTNLVETSTNLLDWTVTSTNVLGSGSATITNAVNTNSHKQFWRVVQIPGH